MSEEWRLVKLGDISINASRRFDFKKHSEVCFINTGDILDGKFLVNQKVASEGLPGQAKKAIRSGDILYSEIRPGNKRHLLVGCELEDYVVSTKFMVIECNKELILPSYLYLILTSSSCVSEFQMIADSRSGTFPQITFDAVSYYEFMLPPLHVQKKIVDISSALTNKEQINRQINQTLEAMAQALFKSWFVDFEPVKAKMAALASGGNDEDANLAAMSAISGKTTEQLLALKTDNPAQYQQLYDTAVLFPSEMVESELGEVPLGWEIADLSTKVDILNGFAFKSDDYVDSGVFVLRTKNFTNGIAHNYSDDVFLPLNFMDSHAKYLCESFDYHLVMVGASVGNRGIIYPSILPALRNQNMWCFRPKQKNDLSKVQVKLILDNLISSFSGLASGSAREFFRKGDFEKKKICFGTAEIRSIFDKLLTPLLEKQGSLFAETEILSTTRESLLPKLLSGELSVND